MTELVVFVDNLPELWRTPNKWAQVRDDLAKNPGQWALINAKGGYPRMRLKDLGCEVACIRGVTYARWPA